jgi:hypothetical protein
VSFFDVSAAILEESALILEESALILEESTFAESEAAFSELELLQAAKEPIAAIAITNINFFICDCVLTLIEWFRG